MHKCSECDFASSWASNTRRHFNRKHNQIQQKDNLNQQKDNPIQQKDNPIQQKDNPIQQKDNSIQQKDILNILHDNQCDKCEKILSNKQSYHRHIKNCKGKINKLECNYCHEVFTLAPAKYRHQKNCKLKTKNEITSSDLLIQNINITNNDNRQTINNDNRQIINNDNRQITNNITLQIRNFGDENKDYITNAFLLQCYKNGYYGLVEMIENVYFNNEHPENHNVRIGSLKNKYLEVHKDDEWIPQGMHETLNRMINTAATDIVLIVPEKDKNIDMLIEIQNPDNKKEKLLKESINGKLIARKKLKKNTLPEVIKLEDSIIENDSNEQLSIL
jgi:hypothetical protein